MKKYLLLLAFLVGFTTQTFGWATVITTIKGGDEIKFSTNISDIDVYLDGQKIGVVMGNNFSYKVKRSGQGHMFTFKKDGYKDVSIALSTKFDHIFWLNVVFGGFFGSSTDSWSTQSVRQYSPDQFYIDMIKG